MSVIPRGLVARVGGGRAVRPRERARSRLEGGASRRSCPLPGDENQRPGPLAGATARARPRGLFARRPARTNPARPRAAAPGSRAYARGPSVGTSPLTTIEPTQLPFEDRRLRHCATADRPNHFTNGGTAHSTIADTTDWTSRSSTLRTLSVPRPLGGRWYLPKRNGRTLLGKTKTRSGAWLWVRTPGGNFQGSPRLTKRS